MEFEEIFGGWMSFMMPTRYGKRCWKLETSLAVVENLSLYHTVDN